MTVWRHAVDWFAMRGEDTLIASFPKSGSTWVRTIIATYMDLLAGGDGRLSMATVDARMPEWGKDPLAAVRASVGCPLFIKTHRRCLVGLPPNGAIFVVRDPRDTLASLFRYRNSEDRGRSWTSEEKFLASRVDGIPGWIAHARSWCDREGTRAIRYEDMKESALDTIRGALEGTSLPIRMDKLERAVSLSEFEVLKAREEKLGRPDAEHFREGARFFRAGVTGGWSETLSKEAGNTIRSEVEKHGFGRFLAKRNDR